MASASAGIGSALPDQTGSSGYILTTDGTTASWEAVSGVSGVTTMSAVASTPNANGASITGNFLALQPADGTNPGVVTAGTQSFGGAKTFVSTIAASNLSGTNTGDVTLAAVGSAPSANGASLSSQVLTLQPADATHPGVMTTGAQTLAGVKVIGGITFDAANGLGLSMYDATGGFGNPGFFINSVNPIINSDSGAVYMRVGSAHRAIFNAASLDLTGMGTSGSIKLSSPNGTTFTLTVSNAGALVIT